MRRAPTAVGIAASVVALVGVWLWSTTKGPFSADLINDLLIYGGYHDLIAAGQVPFRDFDFEYPPGALVPIVLVGGSQLGLSLLMLGCAVICQLAAWGLGGAPAGWAMVALPVVAGALVRTHFDLLSTACAMVGLLLVVRGRPSWGLAVLAVGAMTKLWPAAIAGIAVAWMLGRGERRAAMRSLATFLVVVLAIGLPFGVAGGFPAVMLRFHLDRPVQIESTAATVLEIVGGSHVTGPPVLDDPYKSNGLDGGAADAVLALSTLALIAVTVALLALVARRHSDRDLVLGAFGVTLAFVILGKVLSPQYVCWLLPLAAVVWAAGERLAAGLTALASLVTQLWFPDRYLDVVFQKDWAVAAVAFRNALLLVALGATVRALARSPARARASARRG